LAFYFHWQKGDIMEMSTRERRVWLSQIKRIHSEQKRTRIREMAEQTEYLMNLRNQETVRG
jgi:hypothetical protein